MYSESSMGRALARNTFRGSLCVVDRCTWPGDECDLLVVTNSLRVVDVEIKISRADLKADRTKDKWFHAQSWPQYHSKAARVPRDWPRNVWKHYYAVAAPIWKDELLEHCGSSSGVLLVDLTRWGANMVKVLRRAKPNPKNTPLTPTEVVDVARLASLRMWDTYIELERMRERTIQPAASVSQP